MSDHGIVTEAGSVRFERMLAAPPPRVSQQPASAEPSSSSLLPLPPPPLLPPSGVAGSTPASGCAGALVTVNICVVVAVPLPGSKTSSFTLYVPACANLCIGL